MWKFYLKEWPELIEFLQNIVETKYTRFNCKTLIEQDKNNQTYTEEKKN